MAAPILITGGSGQIGGALARLLTKRGIDFAAPPRAMLDLADPASIRAVARAQPWRAVVNCAAYVAVDKAEQEQDLAMAINRDGAGLLAAEAAARDIPIVQLSTDYVFDGTKSSPYGEDDPVAPINAYGRSKEAGEVAVCAAHPRHTIVRAAWVLSAGGGNFLDTMLRLGATRDALRVVSDQMGCPTNADDIAEALLAVVDGGHMTGQTLHFVNSGQASWYDLAVHIFTRVGESGGKVPTVEPIPTSGYPTPAARPANSRLDTARFRAATGITPRDWRVAVDDILDQRLAGAATQ
jgi:dTDP-4-dehydrorhamnose reductase